LIGSTEGTFCVTQFDAADLAGDGLWQLRELDAPDPLERREMLARMARQRQRSVAIGLLAGRQHHECLRHG
jgi:hypothetical protein